MFRSSITIDAPPEAVFDELSHVERHPTWANPKAQMQMEQVRGDAPGRDARYRSAGIFVKSPVTADVTVTAFERPGLFAIRSEQQQANKKDQWYENTYRLTRQGDGTLVEKSTDGSTGPIVALLAKSAIKKDAMTSLTNLKRLLESRG